MLELRRQVMTVLDSALCKSWTAVFQCRTSSVQIVAAVFMSSSVFFDKYAEYLSDRQ
jgi:hypothetical protein